MYIVSKWTRTEFLTQGKMNIFKWWQFVSIYEQIYARDEK